MHSHGAPAHRPGVSSRTSPTDGPVNVIKESAGPDMCRQSEKTTTSAHERQTEEDSIMAKTLEAQGPCPSLIMRPLLLNAVAWGFPLLSQHARLPSVASKLINSNSFDSPWVSNSNDTADTLPANQNISSHDL
ncbi:hypothetical protein NQZ68_021001 [Dissostichus eleginoides]|nr:hypothetical protein NQZ68_021001 [Dissostichus eleginoides]